MDSSDDESNESESQEVDKNQELKASATVKQMIGNAGLEVTYQVLATESVRESPHIPASIWLKLEPEMKAKIDKIKGEIRAERAKKLALRDSEKPTKPPSTNSSKHSQNNAILLDQNPTKTKKAMHIKSTFT